jgi:serine/threonine protein kinase
MNAGDVIQSRYRLEETLGTGGMATVWRAHDLRLERSVALKCLMAPLSDDPTFLVRFFSEAQQVAKLSHPNVIRVLDFGEGGECPYLVMEFVPGGSLQQLTGEPMLPERAIHLIGGAARGAGAAHAAGLVHRDLKPGNIMIGEGDIAKVGDFGIAISEAQERFTATGTAFGSPHYVSPEQASGRAVGPASDVYSLGVVLYELLAGRRPFEADNSTALAIAHVEEVPQPPSTHVPDLPAEVDEIVMTCLAKDPSDRFRTGDELAAVLEATATHGTAALVAAPAAAASADEIAPPAEESAGRRNGRRVVTVSALAAVFLGLLAFGVMALIGSDDPPPADRAAAATGEDDSSERKKGPKPTSSDDSGIELADDDSEFSGPAPSASAPSEEDEVDGTQSERSKNDPGTDETSGEVEEELDDSEPTPEPTTEPTSEPTSEPAPEPTSSP